MPTTLTSKGQVTIPKHIRDALQLEPGCLVEFALNRNAEVVVHKAAGPAASAPDRFERVRGRSDIPWKTDELMALLRSEH